MNATAKKRILLLWRHPPYGDSRSRETLDIALAFGAFDQTITVLLIGDGVWNLVADQAADAIATKSLSQMLPTLELYGVDAVCISDTALAARQISKDELCIDGRLLSDADIQHLVAQHDLVLSP